MLRWLKSLRRQASQVPRLNSRDAYAKWSKNYPPTPHNILMQLEQDTMLGMMPDLRDKVVLDLACGTGRYGLIAQNLGVKYVFGIDDSMDMLRQSPLPKCLGSMSHIPVCDKSVEVVICGLAVGHYPDLAVVLKEIARVLVSGGEAVISDFHPMLYLSGAKRTFNDNQMTYEVEHYPHLYETLHDAIVKANLSLVSIREPILEGQTLPAVIVYRLQKV